MSQSSNLLLQIDLGEQPMDVDFHPTQTLLATALINGKLCLHKYTHTEATLAHTLQAHESDDPCRAVAFSLAGDLVLTGSADKSILAVDVATAKASARKKDAHDNPINRLIAVSETILASGDDSGTVKLWDSRQTDAIASFDAHTDFVNDMTLQPHDKALVTVSGDGTLAVIDLRTNKLKATSEGDADDELLSVASMKGGKKLVCGTTSGALNTWSWGYWNDCSDRFPGHPDSVTSILPYDDDTMITGSSDGLIRIINIQPNKMLGVLGEHADIDIERLAYDKGRTVLASVCHDNSVKLWDLSILHEDGDEEEEDDEEEEEEEEEGNGAAALASEKGAKVVDKAGTSDDDSDDDDSDDDDDKPSKKVNSATKKQQQQEESDEDWGSDSDDDDKKKKNKRRRNKGQHRIVSKKQHTSSNSNFFSDLL